MCDNGFARRIRSSGASQAGAAVSALAGNTKTSPANSVAAVINLVTRCPGISFRKLILNLSTSGCR